jgi:hypothetical protein
MRESKESLPVRLEAPTAKVQGKKWGGFLVSCNRFLEETNFDPLLKGLPGDMCQCPHWGYMIKGALHVRYSDGNEEVIRAGEVFYLPPGHTGWFEKDTELIEISPEKEMEDLLSHVENVMKSQAQP